MVKALGLEFPCEKVCKRREVKWNMYTEKAQHTSITQAMDWFVDAFRQMVAQGEINLLMVQDHIALAQQMHSDCQTLQLHLHEETMEMEWQNMAMEKHANPCNENLKSSFF